MHNFPYSCQSLWIVGGDRNEKYNVKAEIANLALEGTAASRHAGPSPGPGPPESQMAPSGGAKTSSTALSRRKGKLCFYTSNIWEYELKIVDMWVNPDICNVFLWRQTECGKVLCVALSKTRWLMCLIEEQNNVRRQNKPTLLRIVHQPCDSASKIESRRYLTLNHLHLGHEAELVFDLQENWVKGQLVGLLV